MQWVMGEKWGSHHTRRILGSGQPLGVRSAGGRNYYIMGEGPFAHSGYGLVARDAFNGVRLWARRIDKLNPALVVASGDELYLCQGGELVALDGATGKRLRSYGKAPGCRSLLRERRSSHRSPSCSAWPTVAMTGTSG